MKARLKHIFNDPKYMAILIIAIYVSGVIIKLLVEDYRISEYRWIYKNGNMVSFILTVGALIWSFFHPLIIWSQKHKKWKDHVLWIIIGMLPFLYIATMLIILSITFGDKPRNI